ncbi:HNH endonuclease [Candidatus Chloroploca sp. M-50]|uniref:HNH endonuclease n=1 Tax=Candidatus Chloroploca mongolica TaxID=2528176 RepID=A0ABS4DHE1_9CHLR|nr:HNH endonuclease [Candidatus Chloroploca mongolica]
MHGQRKKVEDCSRQARPLGKRRLPTGEAGGNQGEQPVQSEHILPQTLPPRSLWQRDWKPKIRQVCLHDIGNLVLTRDNARYHHFDVERKKGLEARVLGQAVTPVEGDAIIEGGTRRDRARPWLAGGAAPIERHDDARTCGSSR